MTATKPCACEGIDDARECFQNRYHSTLVPGAKCNCDCHVRDRQTKPCACGRPGCLVVHREDELISRYNQRRYAGRKCSAWSHNRDRWLDREAQRAIEASAPPKPAVNPLLFVLLVSGLKPPVNIAGGTDRIGIGVWLGRDRDPAA